MVMIEQCDFCRTEIRQTEPTYQVTIGQKGAFNALVGRQERWTACHNCQTKVSMAINKIRKVR